MIGSGVTDASIEMFGSHGPNPSSLGKVHLAGPRDETPFPARSNTLISLRPKYMDKRCYV